MSMMTRSRPKVKPTRNTSRKPGGFAHGVLPAPRTRWHDLDLKPVPGDDDAWYVDATYDRRAAESGAMDAMERGLIPWGTADEISRTSLVGHRP